MTTLARDAQQYQQPIRAGLPHILALDGVRGFAALAVFALHYGGGAQSTRPLIRAIAHLTQLGVFGVTLFFILSGFLITGLLMDSLFSKEPQPHALRSFYIRRTLRVFPLYYATLVLAIIMGLYYHQIADILNRVWKLALFLQSIGHMDSSYNNFTLPMHPIHYWSIAVEEHFYLTFPFLLLLAGRRRALALCLALIALALAVPLFLVPHFPILALCDYPLLINLPALALGGAMACLHRTGQLQKLQPVLPFLALAALAAITPYFLHHEHFTLNAIRYTRADILALAGVTLVLACALARTLRPGILQRLFTLSWLRSLGRVSYGFYIFHLLFLDTYTHWGNRLFPDNSNASNLTRAAAAFACTLLLSYSSFYLFERPFLRLKDRLAPRISNPISWPQAK